MSRKELTTLCRNKLTNELTEPWEQEIFAFILQFLSSRKTITVTTSGSTGPPKNIRIKKEHMIQSALMTGNYLNLQCRDTALLCLPVKYIAGKMMVVRALVLGLHLYYEKPAATPKIFRTYDFSAMTPMQAARVLQEKEGRERLSRIHKLLLGGTAISRLLEEQLASLSTDIRHTYGMTETISHIAMRQITGLERSAWFRPLPGITLRESRKKTLVIRAPRLTEKTCYTQDIVEFNDKEEFRIIGRSDHIINSGGIKIFPEEIESFLSGHISCPFFTESIPDDNLGEKVSLFLETENLTDAGLTSIRHSINTLPDKHMRPRIIFLLPQFSYTETGKVNRIKSRDLALKTGKRYSL